MNAKMPPKLPKNASVAVSQTGAKLCAPAAERNVEALVALLHRHAPKRGRALELASGTGQHVAAFAKAFPDIDWQPSEPDPVRRTSIDAYRTEAALANLATPIDLDVTEPGWGREQAPYRLILLVNLLHLIPVRQSQILISEAAHALVPKGILILYGPFKKQGVLTSEGDAHFDAELRGADPAIGYKDDLDIAAWLGNAGLELRITEEMPANNLAFVATKP